MKFITLFALLLLGFAVCTQSLESSYEPMGESVARNAGDWVIWCYQCTGSDCLNLSKENEVQCGEGVTTAAPTTTTAGTPTNGGAISRRRRDSYDNYAFACYSIMIQENGVPTNQRGCINTIPNSVPACPAVEQLEGIKGKEPYDCMACQSDRCNGNGSGAMTLSLFAFLMIFIVKIFN